LYFLTDLEHKFLVHRLMPTARKVGVSEELRGWSWHQEPLKPYFEDVKLPMYSVCSKYCPTSRDVYLSQVEKVKGVPNSRMAAGKVLHGVVSDCLQAFIQRKRLMFEEWFGRIRWDEIPAKPDEIRDVSRQVWDYVSKMCEARLAEVSARQPYASEQDLIHSSVPFLVEHKMSGELLGLSGLLSLDCYDFLRCIMFDLKVSDVQREWDRLTPTGYALVFESLHETPVDVGCIIYLNVVEGKIMVKKDLFFISDELRRWWIEERDSKLEIVSEKKDPQRPAKCDPECVYYNACRG
jgi:CRISPR-associated protein Csa1